MTECVKSRFEPCFNARISSASSGERADVWQRAKRADAAPLPDAKSAKKCLA